MQSTFGTQTMPQLWPIILSITCSNALFKQIQSVSESKIHIFSSTAVRISRGNLCYLIGGYTKHSQTKIKFVQTAGQALMHTSHWLKLEHCASTS